MERLYAQFQVEAQNAFDPPRFGSPNRSVTSSFPGTLREE